MYFFLFLQFYVFERLTESNNCDNGRVIWTRNDFVSNCLQLLVTVVEICCFWQMMSVKSTSLSFNASNFLWECFRFHAIFTNSKWVDRANGSRRRIDDVSKALVMTRVMFGWQCATPLLVNGFFVPIVFQMGSSPIYLEIVNFTYYSVLRWVMTKYSTGISALNFLWTCSNTVEFLYIGWKHCWI